MCKGSTSATTSMLQYEIDIPLYRLIELIGEKGAVESYKACSKSIDTIEKIVKEIKSRSGFKRKQSLYFAAKKKDVGWLQKEYEVRKKNGFDVTWIDPDEIEERFSFQNTHGAILSKQGASIDAFKFSHELLRFSLSKGLKIFDKTEMRSVKYLKDHNLALTKDGFNIKAKKIIYCVGYESTNFIKEKFVNLKSTFAMNLTFAQNIIKIIIKILKQERTKATQDCCKPLETVSKSLI
ncbi:MAG: FAD-dependent oxidoreductase, partial [Sweet potato little leaf phytoplasma]|nr:FAD-dependent oxidoreductase [Sweet potato little leaf phytoplasma]